jgi:UDP-glucose 4-epimerase
VQKLTGEYYLQAFYSVYGLETVSLRYFNIFGPRQDANSLYSAVLAKFITQMFQDESPTIFGDGEQSRDFAYVANAVKANLLACVAPAQNVSGKVFNIATGTRFSLNQTYRMLQEITGFTGSPKFAPERVGDVRHSLADISLAKKHLGYTPDVSFEEGLRRTVEWYRKIGPQAANFVTAPR